MKVLIGLMMLVVCSNAWAMTEREQVAATIAAEGASEGERGMRLIAETIRNRAKNGNYYKVVSAKSQYYGFTAVNRDKLYKSVKQVADKIVDDMYAGRLGNDAGGAKYFRRPDEPMFRWCKAENETVRHLNHIFYK